MTDDPRPAAPATLAGAPDALPTAEPSSASPPSDAELLARWGAARDERAFAALVGRYHAMVHRTCGRILRGPAEVDEATQEAFCRLAADARSVRAHLGGWLHACARSCAYDVMRRVRRRACEAHAPPPASPGDPADDVAAEDLARHVDALVAGLRRPEREAVIGYYWLGRTQAELARELGISQVAVKKRLDRALERLRKRAGRAATIAAVLLLLREADAVEVPPPPTLTLRAPTPRPVAAPLIAAAAVVVAIAACALAIATLLDGGRVVVPSPIAAPQPLAVDLLARWPEGWSFDRTQQRGDRGVANLAIGEPAHAWRALAADAAAFELTATLRRTLCPFASLSAALRLRGDDGVERVVQVDEPWTGPGAPAWTAGRTYRLRAEVQTTAAPVAGTRVRLLVDDVEQATRWCPPSRPIAFGVMAISSVFDLDAAAAADPRLSPTRAATSGR